jgi:hypothetical protein
LNQFQNDRKGVGKTALRPLTVVEMCRVFVLPGWESFSVTPVDKDEWDRVKEEWRSADNRGQRADNRGQRADKDSGKP